MFLNGSKGKGVKEAEWWMKEIIEEVKGIHSKSEKVCRTAFSVKKLRKKCVNPGAIFGLFGVVLGHFV